MNVLLATLNGTAIGLFSSFSKTVFSGTTFFARGFRAGAFLATGFLTAALATGAFFSGACFTSTLSVMSVILLAGLLYGFGSFLLRCRFLGGPLAGRFRLRRRCTLLIQKPDNLVQLLVNRVDVVLAGDIQAIHCIRDAGVEGALEFVQPGLVPNLVKQPGCLGLRVVSHVPNGVLNVVNQRFGLCRRLLAELLAFFDQRFKAFR